MNKRLSEFDKVFKNTKDPKVQKAMAKYVSNWEPGDECVVQESNGRYMVYTNCGNGKMHVSDLYPQRRGDIVRVRG